MKKCFELWIKVMRMDDERLMKLVMLEGLEMGVKVKWVKWFVERFLLRVAWSSCLAVSMPLDHVSKRFEEFVTSGKVNSDMFQPFVQDQMGLLTTNTFPAI